MDHLGRLGPAELEALLCDEDEGCPMEDTVPAAMRAVEVDNLTSMDENDMQCTLDQRDEAAQGEGIAGGEASNRPGRGGRAPSGDGGIDLPAFAKILRNAQQDRLDLYESRQISKDLNQ